MDSNEACAINLETAQDELKSPFRNPFIMVVAGFALGIFFTVKVVNK